MSFEGIRDCVELQLPVRTTSQGRSKLFQGGVAKVYIPHVVSGGGGLGACSPRLN